MQKTPLKKPKAGWKNCIHSFIERDKITGGNKSKEYLYDNEGKENIYNTLNNGAENIDHQLDYNNKISDK